MCDNVITKLIFVQLDKMYGECDFLIVLKICVAPIQETTMFERWYVVVGNDIGAMVVVFQ